MPLPKFLRSFSGSRRALRALDRIADAQWESTLLLRRIADRVAPEPLPADPIALKTTGVSFSKDQEQVRIQAFVEQCYRDLKREPTEQEIVDHLDGVAVGLR